MSEDDKHIVQHGELPNGMHVYENPEEAKMVVPVPTDYAEEGAYFVASGKPGKDINFSMGGVVEDIYWVFNRVITEAAKALGVSHKEFMERVASAEVRRAFPELDELLDHLISRHTEEPPEDDRERREREAKKWFNQ